jgi:hypothetical protein
MTEIAIAITKDETIVITTPPRIEELPTAEKGNDVAWNTTTDVHLREIVEGMMTEIIGIAEQTETGIP